MINGQYLISELKNRRRRTAVNIGLVALVTCVLICITLLAGALNRAFQAPLKDIGANMTVQLAGDVPEQMAGPVLPCSVAPISAELSKTISSLPAIQSISQALLFWDFSDEGFQIVVGIQPDDRAGPALLRGSVTTGRMLTRDDSSKALAEVVWAKKAGLGPGDQVKVGGRIFTIVGLVDTSTLSSIGTANLYITLSEARDIVATAPGVAKIHSFGPQDSNLLFIQADRDKTEDVAGKIKQILGEKTTVSTPNSFKQLLGSLFTLTQRFSGMISGLVFLLALLLIMRNAAAAVRERVKEIGTMKAIGWTGRDIRSQLLAENSLYIVLGTLLGLVLGGLAAWGLSFISIAIPIPWDMAPTPHFLPGGEEQLFHEVRLVMEPGLRFLLLVTVVPLFLGLAAVWSASRFITRLQTSEVLRYE
ncbi:MAG TPA: FtsX-like permease family protein [Desulfocapsa sulfexigens]|nr:FtsX-like permease family protein [Desulfocapsa sulfexigens]